MEISVNSFEGCVGWMLIVFSCCFFSFQGSCEGLIGKSVVAHRRWEPVLVSSSSVELSLGVGMFLLTGFYTGVKVFGFLSN